MQLELSGQLHQAEVLVFLGESECVDNRHGAAQDLHAVRRSFRFSIRHKTSSYGSFLEISMLGPNPLFDCGNGQHQGGECRGEEQD